MGLILETIARDAACNAVVDLIDTGTGAGYLQFETSGDVEVATCTFSATAFGASSSGTATAASITSDSSATGGTVAQFSIYLSDATKILEGTATEDTTDPPDITLSSATIGAGDTVSISSLTITMPAS